MKDRRCWGCTDEKPIDEFPKHEDNRGKFCHSRYCVECEDWYRDHNMQLHVRKSINWDEYVVENFINDAY